MVSEVEAAKKWCPFARIGDADLRWISVNRIVREDLNEGLPESARCVGSDCMAWRAPWMGLFGGYCGLARQP